MKNSILNYKTEELDEFIVRDYFSKNIGVYNIFSELKQYIEPYKIQNGDKLERISYELYGNTSYWDILLQLNDRNPLFQMPYKFDYIEEVAEEAINQYKNVIFSHSPLSDERSQVLLQDLMNKNDISNEEYRVIYVIKPNLLNEAISILKTKGYL